MKVALTLTCLLLAASPLALAQDNSQTQAPTTTPTPTSTSTGTPTPTSTGSPTPTPTSTSTQTSTPTPTRTRVPPTPGPTVAPPNVQPPVQPPNQPPSPTGTPAPTNSPNSPQTNSVGSSGSVPTSQATVSGSPSDADILYFAYNLEVFEAQFYSCAANGSPIDSSLLGGGPAPTGCQKANLTSNTGTYASELAREETAHVALLQKALQAAGVNPIAPAVDISVTPFNAAAQVATGQQNLNPPFNPYANDWFFLHASFLFEDTGASAYIGALNSISNSSYRLTAAQIAGTEVYHAALGRTLLFQNLDYVPAYGLTIRQITDGIVNAVNTLAQAPQIKYALYNNQGAAISNVDSNALTPGASAQQVLRVVTLGAQAGSGGGFFPNNLNGNVKN